MAQPFNRKPVHILYEPELPNELVDVAVSAVNELTRHALTQLSIQTISGPRAKTLLDIGRQKGRKAQLNAHEIMNQIDRDLRAEERSKYRFELVLTDKDIYAPGTNYIFGISQPHFGCVFSFNRFLSLPKNIGYETAKTVIMHEMGHTFTLPARSKGFLEESLGTHCTKRCLMRQGLDLSTMKRIAKDRLAGHDLCKLCREDLIRFFWVSD